MDSIAYKSSRCSFLPSITLPFLWFGHFPSPIYITVTTSLLICVSLDLKSFQVIIDLFQQCWCGDNCELLVLMGLPFWCLYCVRRLGTGRRASGAGKDKDSRLRGRPHHQSGHELPPYSYEFDRSAFCLETFSPLRNVMDTRCGISENTEIQKKHAFRASPSPDTEALTLQLCWHLFKMICPIMYAK